MNRPEHSHMVACHHCELVQAGSNTLCQVCGHSLVIHKSQSLQRCWSLLVTAFIFYIPANMLPMMTTIQVGGTTEATITGGVVMLWEHGSYVIAAIIFIASLLVPLAKFAAIAGLCVSQQNRNMLSPANKLFIYKYTEFVGRWSMVDVFVVGFLAALIQMGSLMSVHPGPAALAFAFMVVFTMLAANSIDPSIFWNEGAQSDE